MTKNEAARENCRTSAQARNLKAQQLEREIQSSSASPTEKANMLHTLSKLGIYAQDERDMLVRLATKKSAYYSQWLETTDE